MNNSLEDKHKVTRNNQGRRNQLRPRSNRFRYYRQSNLHQRNEDNSTRLHITNLNLGFDNNALKNMLEQYGTLNRWSIQFDEMGRSTGIADVEYENQKDALLALITLKQLKFNGEKLEVDYSTTIKQNKRHRRNVEQRTMTRKVFKENRTRKLFRRREPSNSSQNNTPISQERDNVIFEDDHTNNSPTDNSPTNNSPTNNSPTNNSPTDNSPTNNSPTNNSPTNNSPTNNSPTDNSPTDNSPTDNSPTDNSPTNNSPTNNSPGNEPPAEDLVYTIIMTKMPPNDNLSF